MTEEDRPPEEAVGRPYKPFDVTVKQLVEADPAGWLRYIGSAPSGPVRVIDSDLSTLLIAADKVIRVDEVEPWLAHIEFQTGADAELPLRLLQYSVHLTRRHGLAVQSTAVLLRPGADAANLTGLFVQSHPGGSAYLEFRFAVVRVWEEPVESLLSGSLWTLPLAPVSAVDESALPGVIERMAARVIREVPADQAATIWSATYFMMGLRYPEAVAGQLLQGVRGMKESTTYQAVLAEGRAEGRVEGRVEGARRVLLIQARKRFGPPDARTQATIDALSDPQQIDRMAERLMDVTSWTELLAELN